MQLNNSGCFEQHLQPWEQATAHTIQPWIDTLISSDQGLQVSVTIHCLPTHICMASGMPTAVLLPSCVKDLNCSALERGSSPITGT